MASEQPHLPADEQPGLPQRRYSPAWARLELGKTALRPGMTVRLRPADYVYDDDWLNPRDLLLKITYIGDRWSNSGVDYVLIEGDQVSGAELRARWRTVLVRLDALAESLTPIR